MYYFLDILFFLNIITLIANNIIKPDSTIKSKDIFRIKSHYKVARAIIFIILWLLGYVISSVNWGTISFINIPILFAGVFILYLDLISENIKFSQKIFINITSVLSLIGISLFFPLPMQFSLQEQITSILNTNIIMIEIVLIIYIFIMFYIPIISIFFLISNCSLLFNKVRKKNIKIKISEHAKMFYYIAILSGGLTLLLLNSQWIEYPQDFKFDRFSNE